jgi:translation initiation factor 2 gamma subunit (eIF-2gamma)
MASLLGAVLGATGHVALGGTRDVATISAVRADRCDEEVADEAAAILARLPTTS